MIFQYCNEDCLPLNFAVTFEAIFFSDTTRLQLLRSAATVGTGEQDKRSTSCERWRGIDLTIWSMDKCCASWLELCDAWDICYFPSSTCAWLRLFRKYVLEECWRCLQSEVFFVLAGQRLRPFWSFVFVGLCKMTWPMCKLNHCHTMCYTLGHLTVLGKLVKERFDRFSWLHVVRSKHCWAMISHLLLWLSCYYYFQIPFTVRRLQTDPKNNLLKTNE